MSTSNESDHTSNASFARLRAHLPEIALPDPEQAPGRFEAALVWVGIGGTNSLAESLAKTGREGAEQFGRSLNACLAGLLGEIGAEGGQVARLEGNELVAFFPRKSDESAGDCRTRAERAAKRMAEVPGGDLNLELGINYGPVYLLRFGTPGLGRELVLAGPAISEARGRHFAAQTLVGDEPATFLVEEGQSEQAAPLQNQDEDRALANLANWLPPVVWQHLKDEPDFAGDWERAVVICLRFDGPDYTSTDGLRQLQEYYNLVQNICAAHKGLLYRFEPGENGQGHRFYLVFGTLLTELNDAERALQAALQLRRLPEYIEFIHEQSIGVTSSTVFAGVLGTPQRRQFAITGTALNSSLKAAEAASENLELKRQGALLVDGFTSERVPLNFLFGETYALEQPGEKLLLHVAPLMTERKFISALKRYWKDEIKLVGRREALARIDTLASEAMGGETRVVAITGREGIGKSALLGDASRHWLARAGLGAVGVCYQYGERPYLGWAGVLAWLCDFVDADTRMARVAKINIIISRFAREYPELVAPVQQILNVTPYNPALFTDLVQPGPTRDRFFEFFARLIEGKSADIPLMIELENLQWSDRVSLDLLHHLLGRVHSAVVFGLTSREAIAGLPQNALTISLGPLDQQESNQLVLQTFPEIPATDQERLNEIAQGNPLQIVQLARYWQRQRNLPASSEEIMLSRLATI